MSPAPSSPRGEQPGRLTVDQLTSDALDALYERAERAEQRLTDTQPLRRPARSSAEQQLHAQTRAAFTATGISQAEACRRLGLSTKHLNRMLLGHDPLSLHWAERLLALGGMRLVIAVEYATPEEDTQ